MVDDMAADMEVDKVADMVVDKVADMVADMFADIVAKKGTQFGRKKRVPIWQQDEKRVPNFMRGACKKKKMKGFPIW